MVSRRIFFALPLTGADPGQEIPFFVQGFVLSEKGRTDIWYLPSTIRASSLIFRVIPENAFLQQMKYRVGDATEARLPFYLAADRDSTSGSAINLNVTTIDTDIDKHQS